MELMNDSMSVTRPGTSILIHSGSASKTLPLIQPASCSMTGVLRALILLALLLSRAAVSQELGCHQNNYTKHCEGANVTSFPSNVNAKTIIILDANLVRLDNINLSCVETLTIHRSKIQEIGKFKHSDKLHTLDLRDNMISKIEEGAFDDLSELIFLILSDNHLTTIPVFKNRKKNLKSLYLHGNLIDELKLGALKNLPSLKKLYLGNNKFEVIPNTFFNKTLLIEDLNFENSPIRYIEENAFADLRNLRKLNLDGTDIDHLPSNGLQKLKILSLRAKNLDTIPKNLGEIEEISFYEDKSFLCCKFFYETHLALTGPKTEPSIRTTPNVSVRVNRSTIPDGFGRRRKRRNGVQVVPSVPFNPSQPFVKPSRAKVKCFPTPTPFQPCENIMGADWLTAVSFIVALFSLCGNFVVIVVLLCFPRHYTIPRFLVMNLAIADMCMGVYLLSLVMESVMTAGEYYNHVLRLQYGFSCQVLGFLAIFSSELSVFSLTFITIERYLTIVYAMYPKRRLTMKNAILLIVIAWLVSISIALLPILGVGSYRNVAVCLPYDVKNGGKWYLLIVFCFNGVSFLIITVLYICIYRSVFISTNSTPTRRHDSKVANRMALLVFTDFACFAPIAVFALSAVLGHKLIDMKESKFLLVFFFPLNSLVNPFLYALITKSFRRDFAALLKNCVVCGETLTGYLSPFSASNAQSNHDPLSQATRRSVDFNTMDSIQGSSGNLHAPYTATFSKSQPNLVRFNNHAIEQSNIDLSLSPHHGPHPSV